MSTLKTVNTELAAEKIEIKPWRSKVSDANYLVRVQTGRPQTMSDGTHWDGWEHVGHFRAIADAAKAARETARERSGK